MEERFLFSATIKPRLIHKKNGCALNLLKANMKTRLVLNTHFRAISTAKYVHFLQMALYLLVATSGA